MDLPWPASVDKDAAAGLTKRRHILSSGLLSIASRAGVRRLFSMVDGTTEDQRRHDSGWPPTSDPPSLRLGA